MQGNTGDNNGGDSNTGNNHPKGSNGNTGFANQVRLGLCAQCCAVSHAAAAPTLPAASYFAKDQLQTSLMAVQSMA